MCSQHGGKYNYNSDASTDVIMCITRNHIYEIFHVTWVAELAIVKPQAVTRPSVVKLLWHLFPPLCPRLFERFYTAKEGNYTVIAWSYCCGPHPTRYTDDTIPLSAAEAQKNEPISTTTNHLRPSSLFMSALSTRMHGQS